MRGRRPKPTWLKIVAGNPGKRPLNDDEPQPIGDLLDPPEWFSDSQKEGWRYAIASAPPGLLKRLDRSVLTVWVGAEALHREASIKVTQFGSVIKAPVTGTPMQSPYMAIMNKQAMIMLKSSAELGFSPSSRSRVKVGSSNSSKPGNGFGGLKELPD
jgi:P27 family predicted phage terminase small subunit